VLSINNQSSSEQTHHAIRKASCNAYNRHAKRAEASSQTNASIPSSLAGLHAARQKSALRQVLGEHRERDVPAGGTPLAPYPVRSVARVDIRDRAWCS
jgi:hypothetical protein